MSWLKNLLDLKEKAGKTCKQIAEGTMQAERTVARIFHGETDNPTIATLMPIINYLGGSLDDVFADTCAVIGNKSLIAMQEKLDALEVENANLIAENTLIKKEIELLKKEFVEKELMLTKEILAVHNYYIKGK